VIFTIETAGKTPSVPASIGVCSVGRLRLRVEYDDIVQLSDLVVTCISSKLVSKIPSKDIRQQHVRRIGLVTLSHDFISRFFVTDSVTVC